MNRGEWVVAACVTAAFAAGAIAFACSAATQTSSTSPVILFLALLIGLAVVGGSIAFGLKASRDSQWTRHLIAEQVRMVFAHLAPNIGATLIVPEPLEHPVAGSIASFPVLRGTYRGHGVRMWFSIHDPESGAGMGIGIAVLSAEGDRWPRHRRLRRGRPIRGLSAAAVELLARVSDPRRTPYRMIGMELLPTELTGVAEHVGPEQIEIEGTRMRRYADSAGLKEVLDEMIAIADLLPTAPGGAASSPRYKNPWSTA